MPKKVIRDDEEWRRLLTPEQYEVTREYLFIGRLAQGLPYDCL